MISYGSPENAETVRRAFRYCAKERARQSDVEEKKSGNVDSRLGKSTQDIAREQPTANEAITTGPAVRPEATIYPVAQVEESPMDDVERVDSKR